MFSPAITGGIAKHPRNTAIALKFIAEARALKNERMMVNMLHNTVCVSRITSITTDSSVDQKKPL
jgi:hypothetical protein